MPGSSYCPSCGAEVTSLGDRFCRTCGSRVSAEAIEQTPTPPGDMTTYSVGQPHGRRGGDVVLGVVAGLVFGIVGVGATFFLNRNDEQKNERRKDRLFGSWFGFVAAIGLTGVALVIIIGSASATNSSASGPQRTAPEILQAIRVSEPGWCAHAGDKLNSLYEKSGSTWAAECAPSQDKDLGGTSCAKVDNRTLSVSTTRSNYYARVYC